MQGELWLQCCSSLYHDGIFAVLKDDNASFHLLWMKLIEKTGGKCLALTSCFFVSVHYERKSHRIVVRNERHTIILYLKNSPCASAVASSIPSERWFFRRCRQPESSAVDECEFCCVVIDGHSFSCLFAVVSAYAYMLIFRQISIKVFELVCMGHRTKRI